MDFEVTLLVSFIQILEEDEGESDGGSQPAVDGHEMDTDDERYSVDPLAPKRRILSRFRCGAGRSCASQRVYKRPKTL